jgi:hypothetical protein
MYVVIYLKSGNYVLATRTVFESLKEAEDYTLKLGYERDPIVVKGRWASLMFPEVERLINTLMETSPPNRDVYGDFGLYGDAWKRAQKGGNE